MRITETHFICAIYLLQIQFPCETKFRSYQIAATIVKLYGFKKEDAAVIEDQIENRGLNISFCSKMQEEYGSFYKINFDSTEKNDAGLTLRKILDHFLSNAPAYYSIFFETIFCSNFPRIQAILSGNETTGAKIILKPFSGPTANVVLKFFLLKKLSLNSIYKKLCLLVINKKSSSKAFGLYEFLPLISGMPVQDIQLYLEQIVAHINKLVELNYCKLSSNKIVAFRKEGVEVVDQDVMISLSPDNSFHAGDFVGGDEDGDLANLHAKAIRIVRRFRNKEKHILASSDMLSVANEQSTTLFPKVLKKIADCMNVSITERNNKILRAFLTLFNQCSEKEYLIDELIVALDNDFKILFLERSEVSRMAFVNLYKMILECDYLTVKTIVRNDKPEYRVEVNEFKKITFFDKCNFELADQFYNAVRFKESFNMAFVKFLTLAYLKIISSNSSEIDSITFNFICTHLGIKGKNCEMVLKTLRWDGIINFNKYAMEFIFAKEVRDVISTLDKNLVPLFEQAKEITPSKLNSYMLDGWGLDKKRKFNFVEEADVRFSDYITGSATELSLSQFL